MAGHDRYSSLGKRQMTCLLEKQLIVMSYPVLFFACLLTAMSAFALGDTIEADTAGIGTLTVGGDGLEFGEGGSGDLAVDALYINGFQIDQNGTIVGLVRNGDDASFNSLNITNGGSIGANLSISTNIALGSWFDGSTNWNGTVVNFQDNDDETSSNITFIGISPNVTWEWAQNYGQDEMALDLHGNLTLNPDYGGLAIVPFNSTVNSISASNLSFDLPFSSGGVFSINGGNIVLDGSDPAAPSLTLGWVTFVGQGDGLVIGNVGNVSNFTIDPANLSLSFGAGLSFVGSDTGMAIELDGIGMAIGDNSTVGSNGAVALGNNTHADGAGAVAIEGGNATGNYSLALANSSLASAPNAIAFGGGSASANDSLAVGANTAVSGATAVGIGCNITGSTWGVVVLGHYNQDISGNSSSWLASDPAFILGMGNGTATFNGLIFRNNGNHTLTGNLTVTSPDYISPENSAQPEAMQVQGSTLFNGAVTINGNVMMSGPHGDILMGQFVN